MHIASAFMRVGNDGCTRAFLKGLTIKPNLCDLYDIDPVVERARFAPLRVGEQARLAPMSSGWTYHGGAHGAVVIAGRRFVQRPALLAVGWQSFKQGGSWPGRHRVCGGALLCEYCNIARGPIFVALANMVAIKQRSGGRQPFLLIIAWNS